MKKTTFINDLFGDFDFAMLDSPDFKEDSVREIIIMPILKKLGFTEKNIVRSKTLEHPVLKVGSNKSIPIKLVPDYAIKIGGFFAWVLDAKSPNKKIVNDPNVEQVYSYATHPEIRTTFFALCNGKEFSLFKTTNPTKPLLYFKIEDIESNWNLLKRFLSFNSLKTANDIQYDNVIIKYKENFDYKNCLPLLKEIPVRKQATKRHFGVHGYFTKQSWNVVQEYIKNYTQAGDLVLDPFGGSGITAIEAMMTNRKAIHIDLNPMSIFLVESLIAPVDISDLRDAFEEVKFEYLKNEPKTKEKIERVLKKYKLPKDLKLPKSSDVKSVHKLFTKEQLAQLALLKSIIKKQKNKNIRDSLLLMFSGIVSRFNLTYHISKSVKSKTGFGGDSAPMRYYRYRKAPKPTKIDLIKCFELRYKSISDAKKEIDYSINEHTIDNIDIRKGTATNLNFIKNESVDYIYTDPPYGKKIPYLDLSTMWNAWLDLDVSEEDYKLEAIEGGEHNKTKQEYNDLLAKSIKEMYRVLKFDRWMSFVFAHKNPEFWDVIINTAENSGFEYMGVVSQSNGQTSFKKRQKPYTVLTGQLIMNFRKVRNPKMIMKAKLGMTTYEIIMQTIEGIIAKHNGATIEQINKEVIEKAIELKFLFDLRTEYDDITPILKENFDYDSNRQVYNMRKNMRLTEDIPIEYRIKYYLVDYMQKKEREYEYPTLEDIIFNVMPLLKNGTTPEEQTILGELEKIAVRVGKDGWKLSDGELF